MSRRQRANPENDLSLQETTVKLYERLIEAAEEVRRHDDLDLEGLLFLAAKRDQWESILERAKRRVQAIYSYRHAQARAAEISQVAS